MSVQFSDFVTDVCSFVLYLTFDNNLIFDHIGVGVIKLYFLVQSINKLLIPRHPLIRAVLFSADLKEILSFSHLKMTSKENRFCNFEIASSK